MLLLDDIFLIGFLLLIAACIVAFILKARPFQILFWSIVYIYVLIVLGLTLFPIPYQEAGNLWPVPHNLLPFHTISSVWSMGITFTSLLQIGGNILISVPYGVTLDLTMKKRKKLKTFLLAFLFPFVIEFLQLFIGLAIGVSYRSFDIDDFILNLLGVYLGIIFSSVFFKKTKNKIHQKLFPKQDSFSVS